LAFGPRSRRRRDWLLFCAVSPVLYPGFSVSHHRSEQACKLFHDSGLLPVTFELTILFSGFTILFGLLAILMLPRWNHPLFNSKLFSKFSDDGFMMVIEARDPKFKKEQTREFLRDLGAGEIEEVSY
jgi:hypothetical protein